MPRSLSDQNTKNSENPRVFRIATRNSPLAMWQAEHVAALLGEKSVRTQIVPLVSKGDVDMRPIDGTRQVGLFTKRIQQALVLNEGDIAVHSLKDLPTEKDERFSLTAVPERESVCDCLVSLESWNLEQLPDGAKVGTGSRRRAAQLLAKRPDLQILPIRGNVQTRLQKLEDGEFDSIVLAHAGLLRLNMNDVPHQKLPLADMLPAPGQGALGIETRSDDSESIECTQSIDDVYARSSITVERTLLANLHGGCLAPIAAYATCDDSKLSVTARVLSSDGKQQIELRDEIDFDRSNARSIAQELAGRLSDEMIEQGARELIQQSR